LLFDISKWSFYGIVCASLAGYACGFGFAARMGSSGVPANDKHSEKKPTSVGGGGMPTGPGAVADTAVAV
jgi:hypothetical protein